MPTPSSKTNLIFTCRRLGGAMIRLVVQCHNIEIYEVDPRTHLENYAGLLDRHAPEALTLPALREIRSVVAAKPLSRASFEWLSALQYHGLLET